MNTLKKSEEDSANNSNGTDTIDSKAFNNELHQNTIDLHNAILNCKPSSGKLMTLSSPSKHLSGQVICSVEQKYPPPSQAASQVIKNFFPGPNVPSDPPLQTAGQVIKNFRLAHSMRTEELNYNKEEQIKTFVSEDASDAVKQFLQKSLRLCDVVGSTTDQIDANSDETDTVPNTSDETGSLSHGDQSGMTTSSRPRAQSAGFEDQFRYRMDHRERGCFIIFNQENFDSYNKNRSKVDCLPKRSGTDKDARNLEFMSRHIGFEYVRTIKDATKSEIKEWITACACIKYMSRADHSDYDCFGCAILTHGSDRDVLYASDGEIKLAEFTRPFGAGNCKSLAGKPKLFFIQACRGNELDSGGSVLLNDIIQADNIPSNDDDVPDGFPIQEVTIPTEADFLIADSTCPGYYAFRNTTYGSIFIQWLFSVFISFGSTMELMQMMTRVNRKMAYEFSTNNSENPKFDRKKQIPSIATRLTGEVYFYPKHPDSEAFSASNSATSNKHQKRSGTRVEEKKNPEISFTEADGLLNIHKKLLSKHLQVDSESVLQLTPHSPAKFENERKVAKSRISRTVALLLSLTRFTLSLPWGPIDPKPFFCI